MLTRYQLTNHWPHASDELIDGIIATAPQVLTAAQITTPLRLAHFMAQCSEECNAGTEIVESLTYTHVQRIMAVWPSRFPTFATAYPYVDQPRLLADKVYNGRMGNRIGTDDGWNYRGRGLLQLTGRESYEKIGESLGLDLIDEPDLAASPEHCLAIAAAEFVSLGCLPACDEDDVKTVTHRVNGGYIGLADREAWLRVWRHEFVGALA